MIKFGPSGADTAFSQAGYTTTLEIPQYLVNLELDCFEYSFGRGVRMSSETALVIGEAFKEADIEISVHAPYYINFANPDDAVTASTYNYMLSSLKALSGLGGQRCVFHPGSPLKQERSAAVRLMLANIEKMLPIIYENGFKDMLLCAETMGKINQLGSVSEIIEICKLDKLLIPCVDFGHINARGLGLLKSKDDYKRVFDKLFEGLEEWKVKNMHIHFSKIEYGNAGEIRHLTFEDEEFGPPFEPLAELLAEYGLEPYIICESAGTQGADAQRMKQLYLQAVENI